MFIIITIRYYDIYDLIAKVVFKISGHFSHISPSCYTNVYYNYYLVLKVVTNEKGEALAEVLTIIC
jgi:hypothetical protein